MMCKKLYSKDKAREEIALLKAELATVYLALDVLKAERDEWKNKYLMKISEPVK